MSCKLLVKYICFALLIIVIPFNERDENSIDLCSGHISTNSKY